MAEFIVNEKLRKWIGFTSQPYIYKVEEGAIQRYAQAVGDTNPMHCDIEYAANSEFGRLMALTFPR
jgi:acyl dehydratase